jgi:hypothetical protein
VITSPHPLPFAAGVAALALLLGACAGADDDTAASPITDAGVAATLADGAERLAALLDEGDDCAALDEAELLYTRAREGTDAGSVPPEVAREIEDVAAELTRALECDPEPEEEPEPEPEPTQEATTSGDSSSGGGPSGKGNGKGGEKGKGK